MPSTIDDHWKENAEDVELLRKEGCGLDENRIF